MITPKIPLLKDGQILSVDVVNSIIKRTEYAGDLLKQYKLIAGNEMYVEPHHDGTRVSYLQPVGGGGTPQPVVFIPYKILYQYGDKTFVYDGVNSTQLPTTATNLENNPTLSYSGISGNNVFGSKPKNIAVFNISGGFLGNADVPSGFIYNGSTIKEVYISHTSRFAISHMDGNVAVGDYDRLYGSDFDGVPFGTSPLDGSENRPAFIYNGSSYQKITIFNSIFNPLGVLTIVRYNLAAGVSGNNVALGLSYFNVSPFYNTMSGSALYSNGGVSILTPPDSVWGSFPVSRGISGTKMLIRSRPSGGFDDETIWLYSGGSYTKILFPSSIRTATTAYIEGNLIAGIYIKTGNVFGGFIYDGSAYTELLYNDLKLFPRGIKNGHILLANSGASRWFDYYNGNYTEITGPSLGATLIAMG